MASIFKRKNANGTTVWRAVVRIKGYPIVCNHFERKQEAEDWAADTERQIKAGQFKFDQLSLTTGARQGEILNLEWRHIDFTNRIAYIKESKNGRPRSIALCEPVIEELKQLHE